MLELTTVFDQPSICPYLDDRTARMPLEVPSSRVSPAELDELLAKGYRRSGWFYYRTACGGCQACEPLRVDVNAFQLSRSLKRVLKKGDDALTVRLDSPTCDEQRLNLFNRHRLERNMAREDGATTESEYSSFLVASWNLTVEISYWLGERLAAVAIMDQGLTSLSAVYCYFDPDLDYLSLGTYSILTQMQIASAHNMPWLYLGMYVAANPHLKYKARYYPHERWQSGTWRRYEVQAD